MAKKRSTSWGKVAKWYAEGLEKNSDSYQQQVILPNLLRLVEPKSGMVIVDIACGSGYFAREFAKRGAKVVASDISPELAAEAKKLSGPNIEYHVSEAHELKFIIKNSADVVTIVLALQNIAQVREVFGAVKQVLKPTGRLVMVLNHPAFRIPKASSWGWNEETDTQYRRIDQYLTELAVPIQMHPGARPEVETISFHRPLQWYFKLLTDQGLAVARLEEWLSHRGSESGPRKQAEDRARKEIPLFLALEARPWTDPATLR